MPVGLHGPVRSATPRHRHSPRLRSTTANKRNAALGIDVSQLRELCELTLQSTELKGIGERFPGKVRESYVAGSQRTIVVSDRVSCFDVIVGTLPLKGQ